MFGLRRGRRASRGGPGGAAAAFLAGRPVLGAAPATAGPRLRRRNRGGAGGPARAEAEEGAPGGKPDGEEGGEPAAPPPPPPPGPPPQQPQGYVMSGEDPPAAPADADGWGLTRACSAAEQKAKLRAEYLGVGVSAGGPPHRGRPRRD